MAKCGKEILIAREGTEQMQRFLDALNPDSVKLNDFGLEEWMQFAFRFAEHVNYFDVNNFETPSGNWKAFFKNSNELMSFLENVAEGKNITPHLALFVSFVKLLEFTQKRFNKLTKRHLDFYYKNILQIEKLSATADKVHVIFELAKNSLDEQIARGTGLDAGKDSTGKKLIYKTTEELIANKIKVAQLKSVYNDLENHKIKAAAVANSYDGIGGDFPEDDKKWWPFGYFEKAKSGPIVEDLDKSKAKGNAEYPELFDAKVGFALSSEVLELQEGLRNIMVTIDFSTNLESISVDEFHNNIEVYCSGEKKWLGPFSIQPQIKVVKKDVEQVIFTSGLSTNRKKLSLGFQIPKEEKAVVKYNSEVLGEYFDSGLPVCRFLIKTENAEGHTLYRNLVEKEVTNITVDVDVRGVKSLLLESDIGTLNAEKPFYPFGTRPVRKSNFYIDYPELFKKEWKNLDVEIEWKNTPEKSDGTLAGAFVDLYFAYRTDYLYKANSNKFLSGMLKLIEIKPDAQDDLSAISDLIPNEISGVNKVLESIYSEFVENPDNLIVTSNGYFTAKVEIENKEEWETVEGFSEKQLFTVIKEAFKTEFSISNNATYETDKNGPVRLSLNKPFWHELFPRIYALAFSSEEKDALIPNEPYTPFVETVRLDYTAESGFKPSLIKKDYDSKQVALFHEHPFGQTEEHKYLRDQFDFIDAAENKDFLVPTYCKGGELYIGLENVEKLQQVSLLIQVLEGSENPLADSFAGKQKVEWSVLCSNEWKNLDSNYMISNETDNFLKSGIVKFSVPKEATSTNTLLPEKLVWVKAKIHKNFDAVCKTIDILAQSVLAEFSNNENDLAHLEKGLEAKTISKLMQRVSTVKSVSQPFNSFDGKPQESDKAYYRRISERLRHKNRAITIWDYEHIVLQQFPEIHKVKCLNHSRTEIKNGETVAWFLSPGSVLVVVIPDIVNKNVFDIYQPRVRKATLNAVQNWVNKLNTLHVNTQVINPVYEEVTVELKVKFYKGYDENYYIKVLNEDITRLLSPWAFENSASIEFGITLHRSVVINFIEKLEYVDYIEDVKLLKGAEISITNVSPLSPIAILVSAKTHKILPAVKNCGNGIIEIEETCQT
ncbi:MAG: baseplate J/gp47 family protein [Bacteroidetes bacterium]|nr:baseplate J/gp47 family protein [Bacteroidota bacterium]